MSKSGSTASGANLELFADHFPDLVPAKQVAEKLRKPLKSPVWTHHKSRLIELYIKYFVYVTRHGTYIDGFAGPQYPRHTDKWSAKRVIELQPRRLRHFFLCDLEPKKVRMLENLWESQAPRDKKKGDPERTCTIGSADFNQWVDTVLASGVITEGEATFALLDQRTFECYWDTVEKLARHKKEGNKIELFYFLAVGWLRRSLKGLSRNKHRATLWWGNEDWTCVPQKQIDQRDLMVTRFKKDLGYKFTNAFPIYAKERGEGRIMYYMLHATDHPEAPSLMWRAYRNAVGDVVQPVQDELDL